MHFFEESGHLAFDDLRERASRYPHPVVTHTHLSTILSGATNDSWMVQGLLRLSAPAFGFFSGRHADAFGEQILPVPSRAKSPRANQVPRPQTIAEGRRF